MHKSLDGVNNLLDRYPRLLGRTRCGEASPPERGRAPRDHRVLPAALPQRAGEHDHHPDLLGGDRLHHQLDRGVDAVLPGQVRRLPAARAAGAGRAAAAQAPADPGRDAGRRGLAGHHPLARGQDGLDRRGQGHRQGGRARRVLRAARARRDRRAHPGELARRHPRGGGAHHAARAPPALERPAAPDPRGRAHPGPERAAGDRARRDRRDRRQHRPAAGHQADGHPPPGGPARAGQPDLPGDRPPGAALHHQLRLLLRLHPGPAHRGDRALPALLVGAAGAGDAGGLGHQLAGHQDDLRADRAAQDRARGRGRGCSSSARRRPPTCTPRSSPTTS